MGIFVAPFSGYCVYHLFLIFTRNWNIFETIIDISTGFTLCWCSSLDGRLVASWGCPYAWFEGGTDYMLLKLAVVYYWTLTVQLLLWCPSLLSRCWELWHLLRLLLSISTSKRLKVFSYPLEPHSFSWELSCLLLLLRNGIFTIDSLLRFLSVLYAGFSPPPPFFLIVSTLFVCLLFRETRPSSSSSPSWRLLVSLYELCYKPYLFQIFSSA